MGNTDLPNNIDKANRDHQKRATVKENSQQIITQNACVVLGQNSLQVDAPKYLQMNVNIVIFSETLHQVS